MTSADNEVVKQSIKILELPISKFNDVAVPHHLDLLKRHKNNIKRCQIVRDWDQVYIEQINASRIVKQLKQLLYEIDTLRGQVLDSDIHIFDKLTMKSRTSTLSSIKEYLELELNLNLIEKRSQVMELDKSYENPSDNIVVQLEAEKEELIRQQDCLNAWNQLQNDLQELQQLFIEFNQTVYQQQESVNIIESYIEDTEINVQNGAKYLKQASKYKVMAYPLAGALLGSCLGGPVGLLAGLKFGGFAAIGGSLLGLTGGTILKRKVYINEEMKQIEAPAATHRRSISDLKQMQSNSELNQSENKKSL